MSGKIFIQQTTHPCDSILVTSPNNSIAPIQMDVHKAIHKNTHKVSIHNYFQAGRVLEGIDQAYTLNWWEQEASNETQKEYPCAKPWRGNEPRRTLYWRLCDGYDCQSRVYWCECEKKSIINARKSILIPNYIENLNKNSKYKDALKTIQNAIKNGEDVIIWDWNAPGKEKTEVTREKIYEAVRREHDDFGYGYIIAAEILKYRRKEWADTDVSEGTVYEARQQEELERLGIETPTCKKEKERQRLLPDCNYK